MPSKGGFTDKTTIFNEIGQHFRKSEKSAIDVPPGVPGVSKDAPGSTKHAS